MLTYTIWKNAIKLQTAFGEVLTRDPYGTSEEQMRAESPGEETLRRGASRTDKYQKDVRDYA
jgi:hypothetical protein